MDAIQNFRENLILRMPGFLKSRDANPLCTRISEETIRGEVRSLGKGNVLIVRISPDIPTIDLSVPTIFSEESLGDRAILFHSLKSSCSEMIRRIIDCRMLSRKGTAQTGPAALSADFLKNQQIHLNDGPELDVNGELSGVHPDLFVIDACENLGGKVQNSDDFAYDLLVYYARKYGTSIVAFTCSKTELYGEARYEYDLYGPKMELPIEGSKSIGPGEWPCRFMPDYWTSIRKKHDDKWCFKEFRRVLKRFIQFLELDDEFVRRSVRGKCFDTVYALDKELTRICSSCPDSIPLDTESFLEMFYLNPDGLFWEYGHFRNYFGLGVKKTSFSKAKPMALSYSNLKSSINNVSHLFMSTSRTYLESLTDKNSKDYE